MYGLYLYVLPKDQIPTEDSMEYIKKKFFDKYSYPIKIPSWRVQDIDTIDDWERALYLKNYLMSKNT